MMTRSAGSSLASSHVTGTSRRHRTRSLFATFTALISAAAMAVAFVPTASAQVTAPNPVLSNFNGTGGTFTFNGFDSGTSNLLVTAPGTSHTASTTLDLPYIETGNLYTAPVGIRGFDTPFSGCPVGWGYGPSSNTATSYFNAPSTAGIYDVAADLGPNFTCEDSWHSDISADNTVAVIVVTSFDSVCSLAQSYSSDPNVAAGLCDKLAAAKRAADEGATKAETNILKAFDRQVSAQTDKALKADQAETLTTLAYYLMPAS